MPWVATRSPQMPLPPGGPAVPPPRPQPPAPFTKSARPGGAAHLDENLRPVLVLLVRGHEEVARQHGHQAVPLGLEADGGIPPQEAAQGLRETAQWRGGHPAPPAPSPLPGTERAAVLTSMTPSVAKMLGFILARYMRLRYRTLSGLARVTFSCFTAPHSTPSSRSSLPSSSAASISSSSTVGGTAGGTARSGGQPRARPPHGAPRPGAAEGDLQGPD